MSIYLTDVHVITHTFPGDPHEPHAIDTRRTLVHVTPDRPCLTPVTIHSGGRSVVVDCDRHEPAERR
jgi:hypothetical protein